MGKEQSNRKRKLRKWGRRQKRNAKKAMGHIDEGETIRADWGASGEREARLKGECEKNGEEFHPEGDWSIAVRLAGDRSRALGQAELRKQQYPPPALTRRPRWANEETQA